MHLLFLSAKLFLNFLCKSSLWCIMCLYVSKFDWLLFRIYFYLYSWEKWAYNILLCKVIILCQDYPGVMKQFGKWFYIRTFSIWAHIFCEGEFFQNKARVTNLSKNVILAETNFRLISQGSWGIHTAPQTKTF